MAKDYLVDLSIGAVPAKLKRYDITDIENPGFGIRIYPKGTKSWFMRHYKKGQVKQYGLGRYPEVDYYLALVRYIQNKDALGKGLVPDTKVQSDIKLFLSAVEIYELKKGYYPKQLVEGATPFFFAYRYQVSMEAIISLLDNGYFDGYRDERTGAFKVKLGEAKYRDYRRRMGN